MTPFNNNLRFGNFIADSVKGNPKGKYPEGVIEGIKLHRQIDAFSDNHPSYSALKVMLPEHLKRFSGILGDMYFDHFLASDWAFYKDQSLEEFLREYHAYLDSRFAEMPIQVQFFYPFMRDREWLLNYRNLAFMSNSISGLAERRPMLNQMKEGGNWLEENRDLAASLFPSFMADIISFVNEKNKETEGFSFFTH